MIKLHKNALSSSSTSKSLHRHPWDLATIITLTKKFWDSRQWDTSLQMETPIFGNYSFTPYRTEQAIPLPPESLRPVDRS